MKTKLQYLLPLLLLSLLASCWDGKWEAVPDESIPQRTTTGADIIVAMVNNDLKLQVYHEIPEIMPGGQEIYIVRQYPIPSISQEAGYIIAGFRDPDDGPRTRIRMTVSVEKPELNRAYQLTDYDEVYEVDNLVSQNGYKLDTNASMIRFSRMDTLVAAGEFAFKAFNKTKDTVTIRGYFDIPFND